MKITDLRTMKIHGRSSTQQGGTEGSFTKYTIRIDGEGGHYGLGEAETSGACARASNTSRPRIGCDPPKCGRWPPKSSTAAPPHDHGRPPSKRLERFTSTFALPAMSPTATTVGPITWAASGVEMASCDLAGKILKTPVYNLLGGSTATRQRIYLRPQLTRTARRPGTPRAGRRWRPRSRGAVHPDEVRCRAPAPN